MTSHAQPPLEDASSQLCPICGATQRRNPRYPRYLCKTCAVHAVDESGRLLKFYGLGCGFEAKYADTGELRDSHVCFVRGVRCWADEARFGGIVIEAQDATSIA